MQVYNCSFMLKCPNYALWNTLKDPSGTFNTSKLWSLEECLLTRQLHYGEVFQLKTKKQSGWVFFPPGYSGCKEWWDLSGAVHFATTKRQAENWIVCFAFVYYVPGKHKRPGLQTVQKGDQEKVIKNVCNRQVRTLQVPHFSLESTATPHTLGEHSCLLTSPHKILLRSSLFKNGVQEVTVNSFLLHK